MRVGQGPPGRERPGPTAGTGPIQRSATTTDKPIICHAGVAERFRRHRTAERLPALCPCGPDPWLCRCSKPPLSELMVDGGRAAALHLLDAGYPPILRRDTLAALRRRGGADRQLAQELYELVGGDGV